MSVSIGELAQMQSLSLRMKIKKSERRIEEWHDSHDGMIYIAFSGGIDSSALGFMVRQLYPDVPLVFCNTGQEYSAIVNFVKSTDNVTVIRPDHSYKWVKDNYGYPVISKAVAVAISRYRTAKDDIQRNIRLYGGVNPSSGKIQKMGVIPKKYHYLINAPFKISDKCCDVLKKNPFKKYAKETGRAPMTGEMAADSNMRKMKYLEHGCNFYGRKAHKSTPLGFWTHSDVLAYIKKFDVPYCREYYGDIVFDNGKLKTTKGQHSGCAGCMFGVHLEDPENNRFIRMRKEDPLRWDIFINKYGQGRVMDFIGVKY